MTISKVCTDSLLFENKSSDPAGTEGQVVYNSTDKKLKYYDGTAWVDAGAGDPLTFCMIYAPVAGGVGNIAACHTCIPIQLNKGPFGLLVNMTCVESCCTWLDFELSGSCFCASSVSSTGYAYTQNFITLNPSTYECGFTLFYNRGYKNSMNISSTRFFCCDACFYNTSNLTHSTGIKIRYLNCVSYTCLTCINPVTNFDCFGAEFSTAQYNCICALNCSGISFGCYPCGTSIMIMFDLSGKVMNDYFNPFIQYCSSATLGTVIRNTLHFWNFCTSAWVCVNEAQAIQNIYVSFLLNSGTTNSTLNCSTNSPYICNNKVFMGINTSSSWGCFKLNYLGIITMDKFDEL